MKRIENIFREECKMCGNDIHPDEFCQEHDMCFYCGSNEGCCSADCQSIWQE